MVRLNDILVANVCARFSRIFASPQKLPPSILALSTAYTMILKSVSPELTWHVSALREGDAL